MGQEPPGAGSGGSDLMGQGPPGAGKGEGTPALDAHPPIRDYALIGDCHGAALVSRDGSVDWCTLGRFDANPVFCRILDAGKGGFLSLRPAERYEVERRYLGRTNLLRTTFRTTEGRAAVTDFMPVGRAEGSGVHDYVTLGAPFWLVRLVEGEEGRVPFDARYRPSVEFARRPARLSHIPGGVAVEEGPLLVGDVKWEVEGDLAIAAFQVAAGERRCLVLAPGPIELAGLEERLGRSLEITRSFWEEWADYCRYDGPYRECVVRSALALKLLTYAPTGAIVAAPTTSLPEEIGGVRNWDYRFCWLRDSAFTLYALAALGYSGEAEDFSEFLMRACAARDRLQVLYGVGGETELTEGTLEHLEGYRKSAPVRVGNAACDQRQLDIYGSVLDWAHVYRELGARFGSQKKAFLRREAEFVAEHWSEPEDGIWEARGTPRHYTYGKIMSWVAADRALRILGPDPELERVRDEIRRWVWEHGIDPAGGHLCQAKEEPGPDAALLLAPLVGFPTPPGTFRRTVTAVQERLGAGDFVYRYKSDDGLPGDEGAFLICSFWLVEALLALDRGEEARALYERVLGRANDLGLFAEEIDPETGEFLGNFPQAFTHLALIQAAVNMELYETRGAEALRGTHAHRARRAVEATHGWRAVWAAFKKTGRVGRILSSRDSIMPSEWRAPSAPADWRMEAMGWPVAPKTILSPFARGAGESPE